jgi:hypothetical protein
MVRYSPEEAGNGKVTSGGVVVDGGADRWVPEIDFKSDSSSGGGGWESSRCGQLGWMRT